jgi:hypothetical protein
MSIFSLKQEGNGPMTILRSKPEVPPAAVAEEVDIQNISHLHEVPVVAELYSKRGSLHENQHALEAQLREVQQTLEATEERVTAAMTPTLAREGVPIVEELLAILERLDDAVQRYSAYGHRTRRLLNAHLVLLPWSLAYIPGCSEPLRRVLAKLQRVSQE